jgi:DNA modification methylase
MDDHFKNETFYERLMLSSLDCLDFMRDQPDATYDLIVADPPYNDVVATEWDQQWSDDAAYLAWLSERIHEMSRLLTPIGNLLLYCKRQLLSTIHQLCARDLIEQRIIMWVRRRNCDVTRGKSLGSGYEPILWFSKTNEFIFNADQAKIAPDPHLRQRKEYQPGGRLEKGVGLTDAWTDIPALPHNSPEKVDHPTQKPQCLSNRLISLFSISTSRVYIPFAGSGSEIIACQTFHRAWDATEINPTYIDLIQSRIAQARF